MVLGTRYWEDGKVLGTRYWEDGTVARYLVRRTRKNERRSILLVPRTQNHNAFMEKQDILNKKPIKSFLDLEVYQDSYKASIIVYKKIIPFLPREEKYDLSDHLRRSSKTIPRLIAEGFGHKHQNRHFRKYLDDSIGECGEMIVCLNHCVDLYGDLVDVELCKKLIRLYDKCSKQTFKLAQKWHNFGDLR